MNNKLKVGDRVQLNDKHPNSGELYHDTDGKDYAWPVAGAWGTITKLELPRGCWVEFDDYPHGTGWGWPMASPYFKEAPAPTDDLARLQAENKRLKEALSWYAEDMNYLVEKIVYDKHGLPWYAYVAEGDVQERARKALEGSE